jgi:hypothetical protein
MTGGPAAKCILHFWAGGFALAVQLLKIPFSASALWHGMARWLISLAG